MMARGVRITRSSAPVQVTLRDREILRWAGRQRFVTAELLSLRRWELGRFGAGRLTGERGALSQIVLRNRLFRLREAGLVTGKRYLAEGGSAFTVTGRGLGEAGLVLPEAKVDTRTYAHDLGMARLCIQLEDEFGAEAVLTEREIRALDTGLDSPIYSPGSRGSSGAMHKRHYPDLALELDGDEGPLAIELELSEKGQRRLGDIMGLYRRARHLAGVRYYVADATTERAVRRAVAVSEVNEHREFVTIRSLTQPMLI